MNLLKETTEDIEKSGHKIEDIVFIGSEKTGHECTWEQFASMADRDYDNGFGSPQVAQDLVIVFADGATMTRGEYDGSEWWQYSTPFERPTGQHSITSLFAGPENVGWVDLGEINHIAESA